MPGQPNMASVMLTRVCVGASALALVLAKKKGQGRENMQTVFGFQIDNFEVAKLIKSFDQRFHAMFFDKTSRDGIFEGQVATIASMFAASLIASLAVSTLVRRAACAAGQRFVCHGASAVDRSIDAARIVACEFGAAFFGACVDRSGALLLLWVSRGR